MHIESSSRVEAKNISVIFLIDMRYFFFSVQINSCVVCLFGTKPGFEYFVCSFVHSCQFGKLGQSIESKAVFFLFISYIEL